MGVAVGHKHVVNNRHPLLCHHIHGSLTLLPHARPLPPLHKAAACTPAQQMQHHPQQHLHQLSIQLAAMPANHHPPHQQQHPAANTSVVSETPRKPPPPPPLLMRFLVVHHLPFLQILSLLPCYDPNNTHLHPARISRMGLTRMGLLGMVAIAVVTATAAAAPSGGTVHSAVQRGL